MDQTEYRRRYEELEALAESGQRSWRSVMAEVALLSLHHGFERGAVAAVEQCNEALSHD